MKRLVLGLVIGLFVGLAGTAIAASSYIEAQYAKFNIQINNDEAVEVEAVVVDGVSNYPIRVIMDLLGNEVDYIGETRTIVVTTPAIDTVEVIQGSSLETPKEKGDVMPEYIPAGTETYTDLASVNARYAEIDAMKISFNRVLMSATHSLEQKQEAVYVITQLNIETNNLDGIKRGLEYQLNNAGQVAEKERQQQIADLNEKIRTVERNITKAESDITALTNSIAASKSNQREGWKDEVERSEKLLLEAEANLTYLQNELADLQSQLNALQ